MPMETELLLHAIKMVLSQAERQKTPAIQPRPCSESGGRMLLPLKAAFTLLPLLQLISAAPSHLQTLKEVTIRIQNFNSEAQLPCNDTRVAQVPFTDPKLPEQELLCQAEVALTKVTRCKDTYEPLISNLKLLHGKKSCVLSDDNELYLRHFLPALGNFTQGLFRRRGWAAQ